MARHCSAERPSLLGIISFDGDSALDEIDYEERIAASDPAEPVRPQQEAPCGIFYTGGTTGVLVVEVEQPLDFLHRMGGAGHGTSYDAV